MRKSVNRAIIIPAFAIFLLSSLAVCLATYSNSSVAILLTDDNRYIAEATPTGVVWSYDENGNLCKLDENGTFIMTSDDPSQSVLESTLVNAEYIKNHLISAVSNIEATYNAGSYKIPELLISYNTLVVFTTEDEAGWHIDKNNQLTLNYALDLDSNSNSDNSGEHMVVGYIKDGKVIESHTEKSKEFSYTITADTTGEYYFFVQNASAGNLIIHSGTIQ